MALILKTWLEDLEKGYGTKLLNLLKEHHPSHI
jgi:hypothetical protein